MRKSSSTHPSPSCFRFPNDQFGAKTSIPSSLMRFPNDQFDADYEAGDGDTDVVEEDIKDDVDKTQQGEESRRDDDEETTSEVQPFPRQDQSEHPMDKINLGFIKVPRD
ncbi:Uncharacterized protein Rs2_39022 [Raphanus sativus]|nr:Uncharacterized protein Rs2_39022 [Raphanus sativus]